MRIAPRSFRLHVRGPSTSVEGATDSAVPGSTARYGGSSTTRREGLRFLGAWFSLGRSDVPLSRAAADDESRRTGSTGHGGSQFVGYRRSPGRHRCGIASVDETSCSSERQRGTDRRAHPPSGGARRNSEVRCPGFCVHWDRYRSVWLRPPDLPHPDGVLDAPLRRFVFATVPGSPGVQTPSRGFARSTVEGRRWSAGGMRETPCSDGVRLLPVLRVRQYGLRTSAVPGGQWTSVCRSSYRVRNQIVRELSSSEVGRRSSWYRGHLPTALEATTHLSGALRSFRGCGQRSVGRGPASCRPASRVDVPFGVQPQGT